MDEREKINFLRILDDSGIIAAQAFAHLNTESLKSQFGYNFNTLLLTNNAAEEIILNLNGVNVAHIKGNGTVFSLDWEDKLLFSDVKIFNNDAANATAAEEIRVSVGRTGV